MTSGTNVIPNYLEYRNTLENINNILTNLDELSKWAGFSFVKKLCCLNNCHISLKHLFSISLNLKLSSHVHNLGWAITIPHFVSTLLKVMKMNKKKSVNICHCNLCSWTADFLTYTFEEGMINILESGFMQTLKHTDSLDLCFGSSLCCRLSSWTIRQKPEGTSQSCRLLW